ncbi:MAG: hypothetical protein GYB65_14495, partial [Chloroflexi bacterium]|nr:hypothetical protein [Chloroflexota bacterium]
MRKPISLRFLVLAGLLLLAVASTVYASDSVPQADQPAQEDDDDDDFPQLVGEALIAQRCGDCHSNRFLAGVDGTTRSRDEWASAVDRMIGYGVFLASDERELVIDYLAAQDPDDLLAADESRMQPAEYDALYADALVNLRCTDCHGRSLVAGVLPDNRGR